MKRKYILILLLFLVICVLLPFIIDWAYPTCENLTIFVTPYSESDILGYCSTVLGLLISMIALFFALSSNDLRLRITHATTCSNEGNAAIYLEIHNDSNFDCTVNSVDLCNKKERYFAKIVSEPPFIIKAKNSSSFIIDEDKYKRIIVSIIKRNKSNKVSYCIRTTIKNEIFLTTKQLKQYHGNLFTVSELKEGKS